MKVHSISREALNILMHWNPQWKPKYAMVDNDRREIPAIENSFRDIIAYICDFHREQTWVRWLHKGENGVSSEESKVVLGLIRAIAISLTEKEMNDNISKLKTNEIFLRNKKLRLWMKNEWLSMKERWVRFYRHRTYDAIINTNNGLERQNKTLKYEFLNLEKDKSLLGVLSTIKNEFLPSSIEKYTRKNAKITSLYSEYNTNIPKWLHERSHAFIRHVMSRNFAAHEYVLNHIHIEDENVDIFAVKNSI